MNKSGLITRLAFVMIFASVAVGVISTQVFYRITYINEQQIANRQIDQLFETISSTASLAAYLSDKELISEVTKGLSTNAIIKSVAIEINDNNQTIFTTGNKTNRVYKIYSPFEKDRLLAQLVIEPDFDYIEQRANAIGFANTQALVGQASVVTLVLIFVAYYLITRPLTSVTQNLHQIEPGTPSRLISPDFHKRSEIGILVKDVNKLLNNTQDQMDQERELRGEIELLERRFRMIFESSVSPIVLLEPKGSILLHNQAFVHLLKSIDVELKKNFGPLLEQLLESPRKFSKAAEYAFSNNEIAIGEYLLKEKNEGKDVWIQAVITTILSSDFKEYYQITMHDISKRKSELEFLNKKANFDQLTQLPNRHAGEKKVLSLISSDSPFVLILMDLNGFKEINDIYGHESGDEVLKVISTKLSRSIRKNDFVCRWGGDEFVFILDCIDKQAVIRLTDKLYQTIGESYRLNSCGTEIRVGASFGATIFPSNADDLPSLLRLADKAMYKSKESYKNEKHQHLFFSSKNET